MTWGQLILPQRRITRKVTHCKRGHELTEDNVYYFGQGRVCKICHKAVMRLRRA